MGLRANTRHFTWLKQLYFNSCALIFYVCEGLSRPIANSLFITKLAKNEVSLFLTMKAIIFDTHGRCLWDANLVLLYQTIYIYIIYFFQNIESN